MYKNFYSNQWFLRNQIFSLFPIVKLNANYAEICSVGNLGHIFNKFHLFNYSEIFTNCCETPIIDQFHNHRFYHSCKCIIALIQNEACGVSQITVMDLWKFPCNK